MKKLDRLLFLLKLFKTNPCVLTGITAKDLIDEAINIVESLSKEKK